MSHKTAVVGFQVCSEHYHIVATCCHIVCPISWIVNESLSVGYRNHYQYYAGKITSTINSCQFLARNTNITGSIRYCCLHITETENCFLCINHHLTVSTPSIHHVTAGWQCTIIHISDLGQPMLILVAEVHGGTMLENS